MSPTRTDCLYCGDTLIPYNRIWSFCPSCSPKEWLDYIAELHQKARAYKPELVDRGPERRGF